MSSDYDTTPKSSIISAESLTIPSPTEETIPNLIIEELPDTFISDKKEQNVTDYEVLSKSSDGNVSDDNLSSEISVEESQKDRKKRNIDQEIESPPPDSGGLVIEEIHDVESIGKEKVECAAIIEEVEFDKEENDDGPFKKNKKRKINNEQSTM